MEGIGFVFFIAFLIGLVIVLRLFGAWMLRIDEVIAELKISNSLIKNLRDDVEGIKRKMDNDSK